MSELRVHFIRHGEANAYAEGGDYNRGLTANGRHVTRKVAKLLAQEISGLNKLFTSPLVRAVQTSEVIASAFDCDDEIEALPLIASPSSIEDILNIAKSQSAATDHIAIVGHEPTLSHVVSHLLAASGTLHLGWDFEPAKSSAFAITKQITSGLLLISSTRKNPNLVKPSEDNWSIHV